MSIEAKMEQLGKAFHDFKEKNDQRLAEIEKKGAASAETVSQVEKFNAEISNLQAELKALQAKGARSARGEGEEQKDEKAVAYKKALNGYLRKGIDTELKTMSVDSDPDGGYLVESEMSSEIVKKVFESSPMRALASVQTISTDALEIMQDLDEASASWVGEQAARPSTGTPQLKKLVIPVHELYAFPLATQKILDDAMINVESWLAEKVSEKFARSEATAFISGNGIGKPRGILTYAAGTSYEQIEQVNSGSAGAVAADGLLSLIYSLKQPYKGNASFMMKRATVAEVRKLKDGENQYLWAPGLQAGQPDMLLGYPINEADDMQAVAADALAIAFGDFRAGYQIVDRFGIRVLRDPFSSKPFVGFYTTKRVGGAVKNFEAIKLQKLSA